MIGGDLDFEFVLASSYLVQHAAGEQLSKAVIQNLIHKNSNLIHHLYVNKQIPGFVQKLKKV